MGNSCTSVFPNTRAWEQQDWNDNESGEEFKKRRINVERSTADTKKISPVQSLCRVVTSITHDSPSRSPNCWCKIEIWAWTDCREWLAWQDELKWLLTFRLTGLFHAHCASFHIHSFLLYFFPFIFNCLISILLFPWASVRENTRAWVPSFL